MDWPAVPVMLEYARWKYVVILFVVLVSALYALPNIYPQDPSVQVTANNASAADAALEKRVEQALVAAKLTPKSVAIEDGKVMARFNDVEVQAKAADAVGAALGSDYTVALNLATTMPEWLDWFKAKPMQLGLDLQGGVHFLMEIDRAAAVDKRINALLDGIRGAAGVDLGAVARVVAAVGAQMRANPALAEIDINPLVGRPDGVLALDALLCVSGAGGGLESAPAGGTHSS